MMCARGWLQNHSDSREKPMSCEELIIAFIQVSHDGLVPDRGCPTVVSCSSWENSKKKKIWSCMLIEKGQQQFHFHKMQQKPASITVFLFEVVSSAHGGGPLFFCMCVMNSVPEHVVFNMFPAPRWSSMMCVCVCVLPLCVSTQVWLQTDSSSLRSRCTYLMQERSEGNSP